METTKTGEATGPIPPFFDRTADNNVKCPDFKAS